MANKPVIKAVIYDLDDLMVNSFPLHAQATELLLNSFGYSNNDLPEELQAGFIGMRVSDILEEIIKTLHLNVDANSFYKKRSQIFLELVKEKLEAMPGLLDSLKMFRKSNFKIALASSGTREYISLVLEKFRIRSYFETIVSGDDVKKGKPDPETYIVAAKKIKLSPEECIVLEDATKGIAAAKAAGCKCIAVRNPHTPKQDLSRADLILESLQEIKIKTILDMV